MRSFTDLYDRPGSFLVDHPNARPAIERRRRVREAVAVLAAVGLFMLVAAPGGIGHYGPRGTGSSVSAE